MVISAGFKERGEEGAALERQIREDIQGSRMRVIGPNCLGVMNPLVGLNATFAHTIARKGNVAFLSQSGALLTAILDWSLREQVGFSAFVSTGSMLDVSWGDLIDYFGYDSDTKSILIYMESIGDARSFLSAAREVAITKPIIVIKAGRTEAASKAASSHTGAMTGSDEVFDAALRRCGVLRVPSISDVFYMAEVLSRQPRPQGPRLTILTNAGGPAVLATDALISHGGELAALSGESVQALNAFLPPHWSHGNPIDILGDADADRYARTLEIAINDPASDGLLVILCPQGMTDPAGVAERLRPYAHGHGKPVIASWMGGELVLQRRISCSTPPEFPPSLIPTPPRALSISCGSTPIISAASTKLPPSPILPTPRKPAAAPPKICSRLSKRRAAPSSPNSNPSKFSISTAFPQSPQKSHARPTKPRASPAKSVSRLF